MLNMTFSEVGIEIDDTIAALLGRCVVSLVEVGLEGVGVRGHFECNDERLHFE